MPHRRILTMVRPLVVLVALAVLMAGPVAAQVSQDNGAGPRGNAGGSPAFDGPGPSGPVGVLWELAIPDGYVPGIPVAWGDYVLMIATSEEFGSNLIVHALHSGEFLWNHAEEAAFEGPFVSDGHVYLAQDDRLFALDLVTGELLWDVTLDDGEPRLGATSAGVTASNGVVYTNQNATLFALDGVTGDELWRRTFSGFAMRSPVIAGDVVVVSTDTSGSDGPVVNRLHGISRETGNEIWRRDGRDEVFGYSSGHDGRVVFAYQHPASELVLSDADIVGSSDGQLLWSPFDTCAEPDLSLIVYGDVYRCFGSGGMFDLATGTPLESPAVIPELAFPIAWVDSELIVSDDRAMLASVDLLTGEPAWSHDFSGEIGELEDADFAFFAVSAGNGAMVIHVLVPTADGASSWTLILGELPASGATPTASPAASPAATPAT